MMVRMEADMDFCLDVSFSKIPINSSSLIINQSNEYQLIDIAWY